MRIKFYENKVGEWRWQIKSSNGKIIAASSEGFYSRWGAKRNLKLFIKSVSE